MLKRDEKKMEALHSYLLMMAGEPSEADDYCLYAEIIGGKPMLSSKKYYPENAYCEMVVSGVTRLFYYRKITS